MGRGQESAPPAPTYQPSVVKYGDTVVSKTYLDPSGSIVTQYVPDPAEEASKQLAQTKINDVMSTIGKTASELSSQFDSTKQAFINSASKSFQDQYDPALQSLREDIASRFGTLNSSQFISGLNSLEKNRANALAEIASKGETVKADLVNQDETRKLNEIKALGGVLSADQSNFLSTTKTSLSASEALNDFLNGQWMQQLKAYTSDLTSKRQMVASIVGSIAGASSKVASSGMG
ncbi:MAG: hypothetical protein WCG23_13300 [bacterium]